MSPPPSQPNNPGMTFSKLVDEVIGHHCFPLIVKKVFAIHGRGFTNFDLPHPVSPFAQAERDATEWQQFAEDNGFKAACDRCQTSTDAIMYTMVAALNRVSTLCASPNMVLQDPFSTGRKSLNNTWTDPRFVGSTENHRGKKVQEVNSISQPKAIQQAHMTKKNADVKRWNSGAQRLSGTQKPKGTTRVKLSPRAEAILRKWFQEHITSPYPTRKEKEELAAVCKESFARVNTWFGNKRMRTKRFYAKQQSQRSGRITDKIMAPRSKWNEIVGKHHNSEENVTMPETCNASIRSLESRGRSTFS